MADLEAEILAAAVRVLRRRAAAQQKKAGELIAVVAVRGEPVTIIPSEARPPLRMAADWRAIAEELEAEGVP
jgi:hypothetical protein